MKLSLIVPCYNEAENVAAFQDAVIGAFDGCGYDYEIIFVNDGSRDATLHNLKKLHAAQKCPTRVISFSRNFGKEAAIFAGFSVIKGGCAVVMDCDLQHPPEKIVETVVQLHAPMAGLSALMTTTVPAMEETIKLVHAEAPWCKVVVGGAVLTQDYADRIGADKYAKDAMEAVRYADEVNAEVLNKIIQKGKKA